MHLEFVFTPHPTMLYNVNGEIRGKKMTIETEFKEINFYIKNFINFLNKNKIDFVSVSSWCGGDRDGNPKITPYFTSNIMKQINYKIDIRDNSKKIDNIIKYYFPQEVKITSNIIDRINFSYTKKINDLFETVSIMKDSQRFIISDCENFYHILYIKKLALFLRKKINIVPLFESAYTLEKSVDIIERCIREGIYQDKKIEIMLAYSDTNKRNGLFDSVFQLYFTQIKLTEMAKKYDKEINFFHGIGGSPPRGGSSYEEFLFRLPNESLKNIRITIQGERIFHHFGNDTKIKNTLIKFFKSYDKRLKSCNMFLYDKLFLYNISNISHKSRSEYTNFIDKEIINFFINNTYQNMFCELNCGSRPSKRKNENITIEDIRAITWTFGWSSINFYLPWWLGYTKEIDIFLKNNRFLPWEYAIKNVNNGLKNTEINYNLNNKLINKFIEVSKLYYNKEKKKEDIINSIQKRGFVG